MTCQPRQHHYVTKSYLDGFLETGQSQLYCYGRGKEKPFRKIPKDLAKIRDYYGIPLPDGKMDQTLETLMAQKIEDPGIKIIRTLCQGKARLNWEKRSLLSYLMGLQRLRVPYEREFMDKQYEDAISHMIQQVDKASQKSSNPDPEIMLATSPLYIPAAHREWSTIKRSELLAARESLEADRQEFSRQNCFEVGATIGMTFGRMKWTLLFALGKSRFITSDCPVAISFRTKNYKHAGLMRPDCEVYFPLSGNVLLMLQHDLKFMEQVGKAIKDSSAAKMLNRQPEIRISHVQDERVDEINRNHADQAFKWVFAGEDLSWLPTHLARRHRNIRQVVSKHGKDFSFHSMLPD